MPAPSSFDYAIVRVVPQVEREEFINAGGILFCRARRFLAARIELDTERLAALAPQVDVAMVQAQLDLIPLICAGGSDAGPIGQLSQAERFHWLVSPRSTTVQVSPVHCGLCVDPQAALDGLLEKLVRKRPS
ncbi:MAG: DUF3037 domain-containing protein [Chloroflexi bacterium]|nr:DUF3037 domain-containing protein [Chloroflexota bacterium]